MIRYVQRVLTVIILLSGMTSLILAQDQDTNRTIQIGQGITITFAELNEQIILQGTNTSNTIFVTIPPTLQLQGDVPVTIVYTASEVLNPRRSTLTIEVDGDPVVSAFVIIDGQAHEILFTIPASKFASKKEVPIRFQADMALTDDFCEIATDSQWVRIEPQSSFTIVPGMTTAPTLDHIIDTFVPNNALIRVSPPLLFILPAYDDSQTLTVATRIAARLGKESFDNMTDLLIRTPKDVTPAELATSNVILIGYPTTNSFILESAVNNGYYDEKDNVFITRDLDIVPGTDGVLYTYQSPWNALNNVLVVTGISEQGLARGSDVFIDDQLFSQLNGPIKFISQVQLPPLDILQPWVGDKTTLAALGSGSSRLEGLGSFSRRYNVHLPRGTILKEGAQFTLDVSHTPLLQGSHVAVFIDNIYIGILDTRAAEGYEATFDLPVDQLNQNLLESGNGQLEMILEIVNVVDKRICFIYNDSMAWTRIENTSFFNMRLEDVSMQNLKLFSYPFVGDRNHAITSIVLPRDVTSNDVRLGLLVAARLGVDMDNNFNVQMFTSENTPDQIPVGHFIVLGERERQQWIINDNLRPTPTVYETIASSHLGFVLLSASVFDPNYVMLLLSGSSPADYEAATKALIFDAKDPRVGAAVILQQTEAYMIVDANLGNR